jgi:RimJ/RimL family protein N-acetyltransferase
MVELKLEGRHVVLQPVRLQDYDMLRSVEFSQHLAPLWRHQGATPSPERWQASLWDGVLAQFIAIDRSQTKAIGIVCLYNVDHRHGHGFLAAAKFEPNRRSPVFLEAVSLFIDYVFGCWNLRKLYLEATEMALAQYGSGVGRFFVEEGRLRAHRYFAGRYWDSHILALYRDSWQQIMADVRPYL